jgi:hypothetical protein
MQGADIEDGGAGRPRPWAARRIGRFQSRPFFPSLLARYSEILWQTPLFSGSKAAEVANTGSPDAYGNARSAKTDAPSVRAILAPKQSASGSPWKDCRSPARGGSAHARRSAPHRAPRCLCRIPLKYPSGLP